MNKKISRQRELSTRKIMS